MGSPFGVDHPADGRNKRSLNNAMVPLRHWLLDDLAVDVFAGRICFW